MATMSHNNKQWSVSYSQFCFLPPLRSMVRLSTRVMPWNYPQHPDLPSFGKIESWANNVRNRDPSSILIGDGDPQLPFLHITPAALGRIPLQGVESSIIEASCWEVQAWPGRSSRINLTNFDYSHLPPKADQYYAFRVARHFASAVEALQCYVKVSKRDRKSRTQWIKSVTQFAV